MEITRQYLENEIAHLSRQEAEHNASAVMARGAIHMAEHLLTVLDKPEEISADE